ncbi:aspartic peptidase domain-containing protein [Mycena maculata]|uniref:Aspartic peptidase domain-containing protein n=1 Tax=Mycena maculata TaxID=230809 RepID=A0AAD7I5Y1_9AGAR|nr:aspartic peptidase domain-containing protein [Mycena maculata]
MTRTRLVATLILSISFADAGPIEPKPSGMITLPVRRVEKNQPIARQLRHRAVGVSTALAPNSAEVFPESAPCCVFAHYILTNFSDEGDNQYLTTVQIGTPPRNFSIILDSGSSFFWVESAEECNVNSGGCVGKQRNPTFLSGPQSSSFVNTLRPWNEEYGSGSASGDIVTDKVVLGGIHINNLSFGLAHEISAEFLEPTLANGLMGLAKAGSSNGVATAVQTLKESRLISATITSYRLPRSLDHINNGEVTFGGLDHNKFDNSTLVTLNATNDDLWFVPLGQVSVNGATVSVSGSRKALMDTGTTFLLVPSTDIDALHANIPGAKKTGSGSYTIPCSTNASVAFEFAGKSFAINPEDLTNSRATGDCRSRIAVGSQANQWTLGDTFLKSVYFSTNADDNTISLARPV